MKFSKELINYEALQRRGFSRMLRYQSRATFTNGKIIMVFDYAEEYSLRDYLNNRSIKNKLSFKEVLVQMIEAVEELHSLGYVHSDIKPENFRIINNCVVLIGFVYLFGYLTNNGQHINFGRAEFAGSLLYASLR